MRIFTVRNTKATIAEKMGAAHILKGMNSYIGLACFERVKNICSKKICSFYSLQGNIGQRIAPAGTRQHINLQQRKSCLNMLTHLLQLQQRQRRVAPYQTNLFHVKFYLSYELDTVCV